MMLWFDVYEYENEVTTCKVYVKENDLLKLLSMTQINILEAVLVSLYQSVL